MLINQWYVAAEADDITTRPHKVKLLGFDFTLFRDAAGRIACISDVCVHRGASLGQGRMNNGCVECPYHGWTFNGDGKVTKIPSLAADTPIPNRARVDSYPAVEKYGWVWVFLGDLPEAERPPLPDFPEFFDGAWRKIRGEFTWKANYARVVENGLDFAHAPFVHPSFGDRERAEIHDFEIDAQDAWSARAKVTYIPPLPRGIWKWARGERTPVQAQPSFHLSGATMRLDVWLTKSWRMVIFDVNTPVDEHTTLTRWIMCRNFFTGKIWDGDSRKRTMKIFEQDQVIVEKICPEIVPLGLSEELSVKSDKLMNAFRMKRREMIERGYAIDVEALERDFDGRRAVVIPSPARREARGQGYVFKTAPLVPPQMRAAAE